MKRRVLVASGIVVLIFIFLFFAERIINAPPKETWITVHSNGDCEITNADGDILTVSHGNAFGEIPVLDKNIGWDQKVSFCVPYSEEFTFRGHADDDVCYYGVSWQYEDEVARLFEGSGADEVMISEEFVAANGLSMEYDIFASAKVDGKRGGYSVTGEDEVSVTLTANQTRGAVRDATSYTFRLYCFGEQEARKQYIITDGSVCKIQNIP